MTGGDRGDDRQLPRDGRLLGRADAARRSLCRDGATVEPRRAGHHLARHSSRPLPAHPRCRRPSIASAALSVTLRDRAHRSGLGRLPRAARARRAAVQGAGRCGPPRCASAIGRDAVVVSESFALRYGRERRRPDRRAHAGGPRPFRVPAVYYDYSTDRGRGRHGPRDVRAPLRRPAARRASACTCKPGADADAVRGETDARSSRGAHRVFIHTNATLRAEVLRIFDSTFAITYGARGHRHRGRRPGRRPARW